MKQIHMDVERASRTDADQVHVSEMATSRPSGKSTPTGSVNRNASSGTDRRPTSHRDSGRTRRRTCRLTRLEDQSAESQRIDAIATHDRQIEVLGELMPRREWERDRRVVHPELLRPWLAGQEGAINDCWMR
jgi:hypothetical protein